MDSETQKSEANKILEKGKPEIGNITFLSNMVAGHNGVLTMYYKC